MPPTLLGLAVAQGTALLGAGAYLAVRTTGPDVTSPGVALFAAALTMLAGVVVAGCAWQLRRGRRWPQTPLALFELLGALEAVNLVQGGRLWLAALVGLPAVLVLVAVLRARAQSSR